MRSCVCPVGTYLTTIGTNTCPTSFGQVQKLIFQRAGQTDGLGSVNGTLNPGTTQTLYGTHFPSATVGYAVGGAGVIIKTTDGGTTWATQTSGVTVQLNSVYFTSTTAGYAVGADGTILGTTNGGTTWTALTSGVLVSLYAVMFPSSSVGYAGGDFGTILKTTDSGATWTAQSSGEATGVIRSLFLTADDEGWAVGATPLSGGKIFSTNDGSTWSLTDTTASYYLYSVHQYGTTVCCVGQGGNIYLSVDGGGTWAEATSGTGNPLYGVYFADANTGWAVGGGGVIVTTANAGTTWTTQTSGTTSILYSPFFTSSSIGWAVGANGKAVKTSDGGANWALLSLGTTALDSIKLLATWTALLAAEDSTKVIVTPFVSGVVPETGKAREFGSGNEVLNGIPIIIGTSPTKVALKIFEPTTAIVNNLKLLECETIEVTMVNELGYYGHCGTTDVVTGFPVQSFHVSDRILGGFDGPDFVEITFSLSANWSDSLIITAPTDHSGLDHNG